MMEQVEKQGEDVDNLPELQLPSPYSDYLFTQLVEIVLCDEEYDPKDSDFIAHAASILGINTSLQNQIKQIVAAALIAKSALFL